MNYQFDIDQETAVSLKADPQDSYSWTMMPFCLLLSRYDDKEVKAMAALEVIEGNASAEDLVPEEMCIRDRYRVPSRTRTVATGPRPLSRKDSITAPLAIPLRLSLIHI